MLIMDRMIANFDTYKRSKQVGIKEIFQKQGGINLIKQYARSGALVTAIGELLLLGKTRTALEILRMSTQLKTKQKLEKKYRKVLRELDKNYETSKLHEGSNKVWICWFQGMNNAPELVQKCYESVKRNLTDREIILITSENMYDYVTFPRSIKEKIDAEIIKGAHLSDLLRVELLLKYGGTWLDATVFCSGNNIPDYMLNSELFMFQCLKPGRDGHCTVVSNWYITARSNNKLLYLVRGLLYSYWEKNNELDDYFIFHVFFQMCIEHCAEDWNRVIPVSNSTPHIILLRLFDKYDEKTWNAVTSTVPFHKLSYKNINDKSKEGTYYEHIMKCF